MADDIFRSTGRREPFDWKKGGRLAEYLGREFGPELGRARKRRDRMSNTFMGFLDPERGEQYVTEGAERIGTDVLRAGGPIQDAIRRARGGAIGGGFGTQGGDLSSQENRAITEGLRSSVGAHVGAALPGMYEGAAGRATQAYGITQQQPIDLMESMFTGLGGAESLRLAQPGFFERMFG